MAFKNSVYSAYRNLHHSYILESEVKILSLLIHVLLLETGPYFSKSSEGSIPDFFYTLFHFIYRIF